MSYYTYCAICVVGMALVIAGVHFLVYGINDQFGIGFGVGAAVGAAAVYFGSKAEAGEYD